MRLALNLILALTTMEQLPFVLITGRITEKILPKQSKTSLDYHGNLVMDWIIHCDKKKTLHMDSKKQDF